jgi:hypothetical protein
MRRSYHNKVCSLTNRWLLFTTSSSVRATNVYEERSLGIFNDEDNDEGDFEAVGSRVSIWGKYLALHARKQLAFGKMRVFYIIVMENHCLYLDMWWLSLALFLICVI